MVVSKHVNMHASSEMAKKLRRKTTAYRLRTKVGLISKLMLFINLQVDHFFKDSFFKFAEFWLLVRTSDFQTASTGVC